MKEITIMTHIPQTILAFVIHHNNKIGEHIGKTKKSESISFDNSTKNSRPTFANYATNEHVHNMHIICIQIGAQI